MWTSFEDFQAYSEFWVEKKRFRLLFIVQNEHATKCTKCTLSVTIPSKVFTVP